MATGWYRSGLLGVMNGSIDLINDTIEVSLIGEPYNPSPVHSSFAAATNLTANKLGDSVTLTGKSITNTYDDVFFDAAPGVWPAFTGNVKTVVIHKGDVLIGYIQFDEVQNIVNKDLTLDWWYGKPNPIGGGFEYQYNGLLRGTV